MFFFFLLFFFYFQKVVHSSSTWKCCFQALIELFTYIFLHLPLKLSKLLLLLVAYKVTSPEKPMSCVSLVSFHAFFFPSTAFVRDCFIVSVTNRPPWIVIFYCLFLPAAKILASFFNHKMNCCRNRECYSFLYITFSNQKIIISQMH